MSTVYEHPFEVAVMGADAIPESRETTMPLGRHLDGYGVGFDRARATEKPAP